MSERRMGRDGTAAASPARASIVTVLAYAAVGVTWILVSDWAVSVMAPSEAWEARLQSVKGIGFVTVSAMLVGAVVYGLLRARARHAEGLIEQERLFESIVNDTPDLICRFRPDGTIVHVNAAYGAYFDRSPSELAGANLFELVEDADREAVRASFDRLSASNPIQTHEHRVRKADARERWQRWTNRAVLDDAGNVTEIQAIGRDITAEVRTRREHERTLAVLPTFMDSLPGCVALIDGEGRISFSNRVAQETFGRSPQELTNASLDDLFEHESAAKVEEGVQSVLGEAAHVRLNTVARTASDERVELNTVLFPVSIPHEGVRVGLYAVDMTYARKLERNIQSHTRRFRSLFDLAGDAIAIFHVLPDGSFSKPTDVNAGMEKMFGYSRAELVAMDGFDLLDPTERERALDDSSQLLHMGDFVGEYTFQRKDGSRFPAEMSARLFDEESERYVFCIARDLTLRKENEARLRESEERYHAIFDAAADGIILQKGEFFVVANRRAEELFDVGPGELAGRSPLDFLPELQPDGRPSTEHFEENYRKFRDGEALEFETEVLRGDGTRWTAWVRLKEAVIGRDRYTIAVVRDVTERAIAQQRLLENEEALRNAQSLAKMGSWTVDVETAEMLRVSDEMYRLFARKPEQLVTREDWLNLVHPEDRQRVTAAISEGPYDVAYRAVVNGETRWMRARAEIHRESGRLVARGTTQDITDLKRAQREAESTQLKLDSVLRSVPVGIGIIEDDVVTWASAGLERITGRSAETLVGGRVDTILAAADVRQFVELRARAGDGHTLEAMQARILTGDHVRRWVQIGIAPIENRGGGAYTFSMADITELRSAEERLRELSTAVENAPVSIFITDLSGNIQYVNPHTTKVTGYSEAELIGQNPRIFKSSETESHQYGQLWHALKSGQSWHGEFHNRRKNGELFWERATISPILRESDGTAFRYIAIKQDITQMKLDAEELRQYRDELEALVQARTVELEEARNVALEADRMKSTFLASVSHELRTPLTSVLGFGEVLQEQSYGTLNEKQREYVDFVLASGRQLLRIIDDILNLSKLDAGRVSLELRSFTLPTLIGQCVDQLSPMTIPRGIDVVQEIDQNLWLAGVTADESKLRQVVLNLLSNAVKYTPNNGRIVVRAAVTSEELRVDIADSGPGIAEENLERIFESFRQLNPDRHRHDKGTGLGLALTRRIVELHGGRVWAESAGAGHGSTFHVQLPLRSKPPAQTALA